jgi:carbamoyl-phosphate synthase large subunit
MTDPEFADRTYIEPITPECVEKIIIREKEEMKKLGAKGKLVLLPTLGGQTALNTAMALHKNGALARHDVEMIGAKPEAIHKGEDRFAFKELMLQIGLDVPISGVAHNLDEARDVAKKIGRFPLIIRPAFTLGGTGGGIGYNQDEFEAIAKNGIELSPVNEILIEESLLGWKEYEMEVMRDKADNCVIICSIENFDPMGVHTGDSITVAPIQTLTDKEFQIMRDQSFAVIRAVGVETGGSNIQFGVSPENGRMVIIEMNPRVSRSSALASKATGFPIAKIAAKLAVGYLLDELKNDITRETPASFEPSIDYVVTKIPRFAFEVLAHGHHSASRPHAHHADEKRRRSDGPRPHVQGKPAKMPALAGDWPQWPGRRRQTVAHRHGSLWRPRHPPARCHQSQTERSQRRTHLLHPPRPARRLHHRGNLRPDQNRPVVLGAN